jgi:hypothetical protein
MFAMRSPSELIEGIPPCLGFTPERSLVVVMVDGDGGLRIVLRVDFEDAVERVEQLADVAARQDAPRAVVVIVAAEGAFCPMCQTEYQELVTTLTAELRRHDIELIAAHVVDKIAAGGRWRGCGAGGVLGDPAASPLAAQAVFAGHCQVGEPGR